MARTALPVTASLLLALVGLPAAAAEIGDEGTATDAHDSSELDPAGDAATQAEDGERAARRGGGRSGGNRATANRGGGRSGGQPAAKGQGGRTGPAPQSQATAPGRSPAASSAPAQAGAHRGQGAQRPSTPAAQAPSTSPQRATSGMPRGGEAPRAQASQANANRGQGSQAHRPGGDGDGRGQGSQAHRPGGGGDGRGQGSQAHRPGGDGHAAQAHNGPRAANAVPGNRGHGARPGHARPGKAHKHVVHHSAWRPSRWAPTWHRYHLRGVPHYSPRYWAAGVFYYNPPPRGHRVVVVDDRGKRVEDATGPQRAVNRNNSVSVGLQGGSYMSGYRDGGGYGDLGLGVELGYRPAEAIGLELSWTHHSDTWDDHAERATDPISASVALYAFPWTRVSPHLDLGLTATPRAAEDTYSNGFEQVSYEAHDALFGPHIGAGIEFAVGKSAALDFSGKYIGYIDVQEDDRALPGAFQGNMGLKFYF